MLGYEPLTGAVDGWIPIHVGPRPYAMLFDPYRVTQCPISRAIIVIPLQACRNP